MHMGIYRIRYLLYPAPFKLFRWCSFVMPHLLPCLTTFNIVGYINEIELNNLNVVFRQYATKLHIELHLICRIACALPCHAYLNRTCIILDCASCHDFVVVVYYVVCSFPVLLLRVGSDNVVL